MNEPGLKVEVAFACLVLKKIISGEQLGKIETDLQLKETLCASHCSLICEPEGDGTCMEGVS